MSPLEAWVLEHLGKEVFSPGLEKISTVVQPSFQALKNKGTRFVTVAGTNGKGQTAHTLAHLLKEQGTTYTLWTSPHIVSITERMSSNGGDVSEAWLFEKCLEYESEASKLSYFEFLFMLFMQYSLEQEPSVVILEVGLGGRLDAVNALTPDLTAITSISRDHEEILGRGFTKILREKWGITRPGIPVLTAFSLKYLNQSTYAWGFRENVPVFDLMKLGVINSTDHFMAQNQLMALSLRNCLNGLGLAGVREEWKTKTFPLFKHRGDMLTFRGAKFQFLGSHNIDGVRKLIDYFHSSKSAGFDVALLAFSKRDVRDILAMLKIFRESPHLFIKLVVTKFIHPKAWDGNFEDLALSKTEIVNWEDYFLKEELAGKNILVTGSYYFVGEIKKFISSNT